MKNHGFPVVVFTILLFTVAACELGPSSPQIPSLTSPEGMANKPAAQRNNEGVDHLVQGHYEIAAGFFREAIAVKNNFAEAHFNLGVALDGMDEHQAAADAFRKANEFGSNNPKISENELLKKHLQM